MTKVVAFGAFVEILPGVEGLVHISELADHHVESPSEVVEPGTKLNVKILEIDEERRRLSLSIKQVEEQNACRWATSGRRSKTLRRLPIRTMRISPRVLSPRMASRPRKLRATPHPRHHPRERP